MTNMTSKLSPNKASTILQNDEIRGKILTDKQRQFFGAVSDPINGEKWLENYNYTKSLNHKFDDGGQVKKAFNPTLSKQDLGFQDWYIKNTLEGQNNIPYDDKLTYDYYSFYRNNENQNPNYNISNHFPDTYKRPSHPTFSNESIYSTPEKPGGQWNGETFNSKGKFQYIDGGELNGNRWLEKYFNGGMDKYPDGGLLSKAGFNGQFQDPSNPFPPLDVEGVKDVMNAFGEVISAPQKGLTKLVTGKYQTPADAMGIENPWGRFAIDAILDPVNLVGVGLVGKATKSLRAEKFIDNIIVAPLTAARNRAERMLSQKTKWSSFNKETSRTEDIYKNIDDHFSVVPAREISKNPRTLGTRRDSQAYLFDDAPIPIEQQKYIASHETGHFYSNTPDESKKWLNLFDHTKWNGTYLKGKTMYDTDVINSGLDVINNTRKFSLGKGTATSPGHANEIRERAAQLKDFIAYKNKIPLNKDFKVTSSQLDDAIKNFSKQTGLDNSMTEMLSALKDRKGFLKQMNLQPLGVVPAGIIGIESLQQKKNGGEVNYNDSHVSLPPNFVGLGNDTTPRRYSPAWGGAFNNGGSLPSSVGFTYARTGDIPSNGKYAKKTLASAADGDVIPTQQDATKVAIPSHMTNETAKGNYTWLDNRIHNLIPQFEYPNSPGVLWDAFKSVITNKPLYDIRRNNASTEDEKEINPNYGKGSGAGDELFNYALGYNGKLNYIESSSYKPSIGKDDNSKYFRIKDLDQQKFLENVYTEFKNDSSNINNKVVPWGMIPTTNPKNTHGLGSFGIGRGEDKNGKYMSYYDKYDFDVPMVNDVLDRTPEIYDRVYYKDNPYNIQYNKIKSDQDSLWKTDIEENRKKSLDMYSDISILNDSARSKGMNIITPITFDNKKIDYSKYFHKNGGNIQNRNMMYYQNGLDYTPKSMSDGGDITPLSPKDFTMQLIQSPAYKERLAKSYLDESVDPEIKDRLQEVQKTRTVYGDTAGSLSKPYMYEGSNANVPYKVYIDKDQAREFKTSPASIETHEYSHKETLNGLNPWEKEQLGNRMKQGQQYVPHDVDPFENKADINSLRQELYNNGVDVFNKSVSPENIQQLRNSTNYSVKRLFQHYSDDDLLWLLNNIASTEKSNNNISARNGSELTKLDQLTNWTNYGKPSTKGGWLNKYDN